MAANLVSGKVVLKETGAGIPDLVVVLFDFDAASAANAASTPNDIARTSQTTRAGRRLGSCLSDSRGGFSLSFDDADFQVLDAKEKRPDLRLTIVGPDDAGVDPQTRILFASADVRTDAGRQEFYLVRIPAETLRAAGLEPPTASGAAREEAKVFINRLDETDAWEKQVSARVKVLSVSKVDAAREDAVKADNQVSERIRENLSGMTAKQAEILRFVPQGASLRPTLTRAINDRIGKVNGTARMSDGSPLLREVSRGYLVLTREDADGPVFSEAADPAAPEGPRRLKATISHAEIAPYLFRTVKPGGWTTSITRADPLETLRARQAAEAAIVPAGATAAPASGAAADTGSGAASGVTSGSVSAPPVPGVAESPVEPASLDDLPGFVTSAIASMVPLSGDLLGGNLRPNAAQVQATVNGLRLDAGPSDVTAFHDYHSLQIAFDHVWQQFIDDDAIDYVQALAQSIVRSGGTLDAAAAPESQPIAAMKKEANYIARVSSPFDSSLLPSWVGEMQIDWTPDIPQITGGGVPTEPVEPKKGPKGHHTRPTPASPPHEILTDLEEILTENYKFDVFAPGSTNFGLLVSYRQKWTPITYQAGDLVHTTTMAPGQTTTIKAQRTVKHTRSVKEAETNLRNQSNDTKATMRADAEVVDRAAKKSNFNLNAKGTYDIGIAGGDYSMTVDRTAESASQETKKSFHEDVLNAAMQLRSERSWSVDTSDSFEEEIGTTTVLNNDNKEITVAYLFFELERRFRVTEHLHRLTPVVLVALEVPNPNRKAIDKLLLKHSWIFNRVLLDDRYRAPLDYLTKEITGDELALQQLARNLKDVRASVEKLQELAREIDVQVSKREGALDNAVQVRGNRTADENSEGFMTGAVESIFGSSSNDDIEAAQIVEDLRREQLEAALRRQQAFRMRLDAETANLDAVGKDYARACAEHSNKLLEIAGLRAHVKENVLFYMQAIWSYSFKDQTFFTLYKILAPDIRAKLGSGEPTHDYALEVVENPPPSVLAGPTDVVVEVTASFSLEELQDTEDGVPLSSIADLDEPLGFKGNYMIFRLKASNPLVDMMMIPYIDTELGLRDPDELGSWAPDEFAEFAREQLKQHRGADGYEALKERLIAQYAAILSSPRRVSDEVVVPTDSLFIEALPGTHPVLEDFMLKHRAIDVERAREEARKLQLQNLRHAARLLAGDFGDPDIDKKIVINGNAGGVIVPTDQ